MQIETLRDVLHWTGEFHHHLENAMQHGASQNESERAKLLLDYLSIHEQKLTQVLESFEESASINALNTWCYEFLDKQPIVRSDQGDKPFSTMNAEEIINETLHQHQQVIELYRYLHSRAETPSAQELLSQLTSLEEHEAMVMAQGANRLQDV